MFSIQTKTHQYYTTHSIALTTSIIQFYPVFGQGIHQSTSPASLLEFQVPPWSIGDGGGRDANKQERDKEDHLDVIGCWFNHFPATLLGDLDSIGIAWIPKEYSWFSNSNLRRWNSHFFTKICLSFLKSCALVLRLTQHTDSFLSFTHLLYFIPTLAPLWLISLTLMTHSSHTYSTSFPHLLHYDSYLSRSWLIVHTLTPLRSHACSTLTRSPYLYFYYIYG